MTCDLRSGSPRAGNTRLPRIHDSRPARNRRCRTRGPPNAGREPGPTDSAHAGMLHFPPMGGGYWRATQNATQL